MMPKAAPHRFSAFSINDSNTGMRLPGDLLMTCKTSAVAVCWSSASSRSAVRSPAPAGCSPLPIDVKRQRRAVEIGFQAFGAERFGECSICNKLFQFPQDGNKLCGFCRNNRELTE
jgi:hypothetical protein